MLGKLLLVPGMVCILLSTGIASAQGGRKAQPAVPTALDEAVQKAIEKGVARIWSLRKDDGSWPSYDAGNYHYSVGPTALAAYALLESGVSPQEDRMAKTLEWLATHNDHMTYSTALRCQVWLTVNRQTRDKYKKEFEADVKRLMKSQFEGGYEYDANGDDAKHGFDNSNSQFGVLGVWAGARANLEFIDKAYWWTIAKHWLEEQNDDGGWEYHGWVGQECTASMTAAGTATMFVCMDNLLSDAFVSCEVSQRQEFKCVQRGLDWLDKHFQEEMRDPAPYYLYALERVGLASGYKYFGASDWYKLGAEFLVRKQAPEGAWSGGYGGELQSTVFSVLFLVRGRNPIMFNKLQYTGDWNNRPRALASLTEWVGRNFEGAVNWQIINLKVPVAEWHDAPVLFLSGSKGPTFTDEELDKLRTYVQQGGTILSVGECGGAGFNKAMRQAYTKLFPEYELKALDKDHEIYTVHYKLRNGKPKFSMVSNGIRPLAIHVDEDVVLPWQVKTSVTESWAFEGAANAYLYVTDKEFVKARGVDHWPEEISGTKKVKVARLKYAGNWNPEPLAYERFGRLLAKETGTGLEVVTADIKDLPASGAAVASLTGTTALQLGADEKDALKKFVTGGGLLVVDAGGGSHAFADSAQGAIGEIFGAGDLKRLDLTSPLFSVKEIKEFKFRRQMKAHLAGVKGPQLQGVTLGEASTGSAGAKLGVIFSREDLTGGLVGYNSYTCNGYAPQTAYEIMRNAMLLAGGGPGAASAPAAAPAAAAN